MTSLNLADDHARMGKISLNLERHGDDEEVVAFAFPVDVMLDQAALDAFMGVYFWRSLYNVDAATQLPSPMDGFRRCEPLTLSECYEDVTVQLHAGERQLLFGECKAQKFTLEPQVGGLTKLRVQVYLRPGLDQENLTLQELQHCEIGIAITNGKLVRKKDPQQQLPLDTPEQAAKPAFETETTPEGDEADRRIADNARRRGKAA